MPPEPVKTVVVTGASAGIGPATAVAFGRRGDRVALLARGEGGLDAACEEVTRAGGHALPIAVDVADFAALDRAAATVEERLGPIDVWVNDAFASVFARFWDIRPDEYRRVTEVAYLGFVHEEPDNGIWELDRRWRTHSRLTCVAGSRQIARHTTGPQAGQWTALADAVAAGTARTCVHPSGRWPRAPQGAFSLCGFVLALTYLQQGRHDRAGAWFERNRAPCGPPGLLTEEFDVGEDQLRGNIPQAFVHAVPLECAAPLGSP